MFVWWRAQTTAKMTLFVFAIYVFASVFTVSGFSQTEPPGLQIGPSGLPLPRFASLKSDEVNVRQGAGSDYQIAWKFVLGSLPVEVTAEYENWRRIRDWEGNEGWVFHSLLSGKRTALVAPWSRTGEALPLYRERSEGAKLEARLESGVLVEIMSCNGAWCDIEVEGDDEQTYRGFMKQEQLWGVYPNEEID